MKYLGMASALAALALAGSAHAVTITNGSFEAGLLAPIGNFATLSAGDSTSITGWTVEDGGVDLIESYWNAADGRRSLDLSALSAGGVSQFLTGLTIGQHYRVTFSYAGNPDGGNGLKVGTTSVSGSQSSVFSFVQSGTRANMNWTAGAYDFTADASSMNLKFASNENNPFGPALDNVGIAAVPEPATWALMIIGFSSAGAMLRRRQGRLAFS